MCELMDFVAVRSADNAVPLFFDFSALVLLIRGGAMRRPLHVLFEIPLTMLLIPQTFFSIYAHVQLGLRSVFYLGDRSFIVEGALTTTQPLIPLIFNTPSLNFACSCVERVQSHRKLTIRASVNFVSAR